MAEDRVVVVTGSTRGIGYGLAEAFLAAGCRTVVCGRTRESTEGAVTSLRAAHGRDAVSGRACNVRSHVQLVALWDLAVERFGRVDIWINNAGLSTDKGPIWSQDKVTIAEVVNTNLTGTIYGCSVAIPRMLDQGYGAVYTMEGMGSSGQRVEGFTVYGATKRAIRYLTRGLVAETAGTPVLAGTLSPGMVTTDLLLGWRGGDVGDEARARRIFNILADRVETVAPWLARRILANTRHGARIAWLSWPKVMWRFATASIRKRDVLS